MVNVYRGFMTGALNLFFVFLAVLTLIALPRPAVAQDQTVINLEPGGTGAQAWNIGNLSPGMSDSQVLQLRNIGTSDGIVTIWISNIVSSEGMNPEPETGNTAEPGELNNHLYLNPSCPGLSTNITLPATVNDLPQSSTGPKYVRIDPMRAGATLTLTWNWAVPVQTGNEIQGDIVTFTINYLLEGISPACVNIIGTDIFEGGERPFAGHNVPLTLKLYSQDTVIDPSNALTLSPLYTFSTVDETLAIVSINMGTHEVTWVGPCVPPGTYNVTIVSPHTLVNLKNRVDIYVENTVIEMGILIDGNANNDVQITGADLSLLLNDYLSVPGSPNWNDGRSNFDRNGQVNAIDFSILVSNYNKYSPQVVTD